MSKTTTHSDTDFQAEARRQARIRNESLRRYVDANQHIIQSVNEEIGYTGSADFAAAFVYEQVRIKMNFDDKVKFGFDGTAWGVGLGGGISAGGGWSFVPLSDLAGDVDFSFAVGFASVTVNMYRNEKHIASFLGAGLNIGAATGGGSGKIFRTS